MTLSELQSSCVEMHEWYEGFVAAGFEDGAAMWMALQMHMMKEGT